MLKRRIAAVLLGLAMVTMLTGGGFDCDFGGNSDCEFFCDDD